MPELGPQFKQLTMFEPLKKLRYQSASADYDVVSGAISMGQFWDHKLEESKDVARSNFIATPESERLPSVYDRVSAVGIHTPVLLDSEYSGPEEVRVLNGNHRIAAAADIATKRGEFNTEVPVMWGNGSVDSGWQYAQNVERANLFSLTDSEKRKFNR